MGIMVGKPCFSLTTNSREPINYFIFSSTLLKRFPKETDNIQNNDYNFNKHMLISGKTSVSLQFSFDTSLSEPLPVQKARKRSVFHR